MNYLVNTVIFRSKQLNFQRAMEAAAVFFWDTQRASPASDGHVTSSKSPTIRNKVYSGSMQYLKSSGFTEDGIS